MGKALIIVCGGVASVAIHKCCQNSDVFEEICIASRTKSKCDALKEKLSGGKTKITTAQVDADNVDELIALIEREKPDVVLNLALTSTICSSIMAATCSSAATTSGPTCWGELSSSAASWARTPMP